MTTGSRQVELGFDPVAIDRKWQERWERDELHKCAGLSTTGPSGSK